MGWAYKIRRMICRMERNYKELDSFYKQLGRIIKIEHGDIVDVLLQFYKEHVLKVDLNCLGSHQGWLN